MTKGIRKMFGEVASTYELLNHLFTMGLDILWRRKTADYAARLGGMQLLDVCSGTGEMARYLSKRFPSGAKIASIDFSLPMVRESSVTNGSHELSLLLSDAMVLPFKDNSFDLITISFATRNLNISEEKLTNAFREFRRVLKPGGVFLNLETSQPSSGVIKRLFHFYTKLMIPFLGKLISGSRNAYLYLSYTVRNFHDVEKLALLLREAGFKHISAARMMLGIVAVHKAVK